MALKTLLGLLLATIAASAQETPAPECACKPREVGDSGSRKDWTSYNQGIRWHRSLEEARKLAKASNKLVFYYHVAGDLDKEGC